jgi:hypothetical protein
LDFLGPPRACCGAPQISALGMVGIPWDSLDSLVRNECFQCVTGDPGAKKISRPALLRRRPACPSKRSTTAAQSFDCA